MGKILLTNYNKWNELLRECFAQNGFSENGYIEDNIFLTTYRKINVGTFNLYQCGLDFVACAGTLIYQDKIGKSALKQMFEDLSDLSIKEIRKSMMGNYVVIYKKDNQIRIFVDETNAYAFYYYIDSSENRFIFTNTFYHIEKCVEEKVNALAFMERVLESCNYDNETPFVNIYRIMAEECIVIDLEAKNCHIEKIELNHYNLQTKVQEEIIDKLCELIHKYAEKQAYFRETPYLFTTGGVDSRLILATYLSVGISPILASWMDNSVMMNTKIEDTKIMQMLAAHMGLKEKIYHVPQNFEEDYKKDVTADFDKIGEYACIYGDNKKWRGIFEDTEEIKYADFGYFGETLKSWDILDEAYKYKMNLWNFVDMYICRSRYLQQNEKMSHYEDYRRKIYQKMEMVAHKEHMDIDDLTKEDCMVLYYYYRLHADTQICNYSNMFCYSVALFAQKEIADHINQVSYEMKRKEKLNLLLVNKLCPKLLEVPYFSHCRYFLLNKKNFCLEETINNKMWHWLIKNVRKFDLGKKLIAIKRKYQNSSDANARKLCVEGITGSSRFPELEVNIDETSLSYTPRYVRFLYHIKMLELLE